MARLRWKICLGCHRKKSKVFDPASTPPRPIPRAAALVGDGKDAQCVAFDAIHKPIGKASEGKAAGLPDAWCAGLGVFAQHGDAGFDLQREISGRVRAAFAPVPVGAPYSLIKRERVKGETHADQ